MKATNIPAPPEGFIYFGVGPLKKKDSTHSCDIAMCHEGQDWVVGANGLSSGLHYAVRVGSAIAKDNPPEVIGIDSYFAGAALDFKESVSGAALSFLLAEKYRNAKRKPEKFSEIKKEVDILRAGYKKALENFKQEIESLFV